MRLFHEIGITLRSNFQPFFGRLIKKCAGKFDRNLIEMKLEQPLRSILLIYDDSNNCQMIIQALVRSFPEIQIEEVLDFRRLDDILDNSHFDLVITDVAVNWITGLEILEKIKDRFPDCPVVILTDSGSEEMAVNAMKAGFDDYIIKSSMQLDRLSEAVRSVWQKTQSRQEEAQSELRLQLLLDELKMGVFRVTPQGQLLTGSDGFFNLLGLPTSESTSIFLQDPLILRSLVEILARSQPALKWVRPADGESIWLQIHSVITQQAGRTVIDGLVYDITDQTQSANALHQRNQTLEQWVEDRTIQIQAINHELETFAFSISHDLRSPIRQINGFVSLLKQAMESLPRDTTIWHYLQTIEKLAERSRRMIDDLLHFSRTGRIEMQITPVNVARLVYEICSLVEMQLRDYEIVWHIADLPEVQGDRDLLRQVWQNLIDNAVKYSSSRSCIEIEIGARSTPSETIFFVRDQGIGFDMRYANRLFGVFQRLPNALTIDGSGVGLANVQRIVRRHGGRVWAEGEIDAGATFYFSIPQPNFRF